MSETGNLNRRASGPFVYLYEPTFCFISTTGLHPPPSTERVDQVWFWNSWQTSVHHPLAERRSSPGSRKKWTKTLQNKLFTGIVPQQEIGQVLPEFKSNLNLKASSQNVVNRRILTRLTKKNLLRKTNQELFNMRNHCWFRKFTQLQVPGGWKDTGKVMFPFFLYFPG